MNCFSSVIVHRTSCQSHSVMYTISGVTDVVVYAGEAKKHNLADAVDIY